MVGLIIPKRLTWARQYKICSDNSNRIALGREIIKFNMITVRVRM